MNAQTGPDISGHPGNRVGKVDIYARLFVRYLRRAVVALRRQDRAGAKGNAVVAGRGGGRLDTARISHKP